MINKFMKSQWFGVLSLLIGLSTSYYFYMESAEERAPVFMVDSSLTQIVAKEREEKTNLTVLDESKKLIKGSIYARKFYFWNNGKRSIKRENFLTPILVNIGNDSSRILSYKIIASTRNNITNPNVELSKSKKSLNLNFFILEEEDGFVVEVIYEGSPKTQFTIQGSIEGVKDNHFLSNDNFKIQRFIKYYSIFLFFIFIAAIITNFVEKPYGKLKAYLFNKIFNKSNLGEKEAKKLSDKITNFAALIFSLVVVGFFIWIIVGSSIEIPSGLQEELNYPF